MTASAQVRERRQVIKALPTGFLVGLLGLDCVVSQSSFRTAASSATWVLGLFMLMAGLLVTTGAALRLTGRASAPPPRVTDLKGEPATLLARAPLVVLTGGFASLSLALLLGGWAAIAFVHDSPGWGVVLLLPALWFALPALWLMTGRWVVGGVWLTPTRIVYRGYGIQTWTRWDDVTDVSVGETHAMGVHSRCPEGRHLAPVMRNGKLGKDDLLGMNLLDLSLTFDKTLALMHAYWANPELRPELGTDRSLERIEQIWPTDTIHA